MEFSQEPSMEPYISLNTKMRAAAKNDMVIDFHKLRNNAVYGKTCENQMKRSELHVINDRLKAAKLGNKPPAWTCACFTRIFGD